MADPHIKRAMILAAGLGQRMRPLTDSVPKPLVSFAGRPLIDHVLDRLCDAGIEQVVVNVHYCADLLTNHLHQHRARCAITVSDEREMLLDTGGGIVHALEHFGSDPFITHNSDSVWYDAPETSALSELTARWRDGDMDFLMLLANPATTLGYDGAGDFVYADPDGRIRRRSEDDANALVFAGVTISHPRAFQNAPSGKFSMNVLWDNAIKQRRVFGHTLAGTWMHIGTPSALTEAETWIATRGGE